MSCPACHSTHTIKNGSMLSGKPKWQCTACNRRFDRLLHPLTRIHCGTIQWLKHHYHIGWDDQRPGRVGVGIIHQNQIQAIGIRTGEIIQKVLDHCGRERGKSHKVAGAADRFDRPKYLDILEAVLVNPDGLDGPRRNSPPMNSVQAEPTLITSPNAHWWLVAGRASKKC